MAVAELLYLTQQEVIDCGLTLAESVGIVEGVLREHGEGQVENPPKPGVHPRPDAFIHAMPGYLKRADLVGMKWVSGFFSNPARGLPSLSGLIVLNDADTGLPTAVMDCAYITALRTAAVSGVAARHLARAGAEALGIVGAGLQGRYNLLAIAAVLPTLRFARVFDTHAPTLGRFLEAMAGEVAFELAAGGSAERVIRAADVVVTATGWLEEPIFASEWVGRGALVLPVHARGWSRRTPHEMDRFIVDDWGQFHHVMGGEGGFYAPLPEPDAQLGEVVAARTPGRRSDDERIVDFNYGMAIHDVAMATEVLRRAKARHLGTPLAQMDGHMPFSG
jgi:ornithine cyclodeaminase/alanine dehydrogenase